MHSRVSVRIEGTYVSKDDQLRAIGANRFTYPFGGTLWDDNDGFHAKLTRAIRDSQGGVESCSTYKLNACASGFDGLVAKVPDAPALVCKSTYALPWRRRTCLIFTDPEG